MSKYECKAAAHDHKELYTGTNMKYTSKELTTAISKHLAFRKLTPSDEFIKLCNEEGVK